MSGDHTENENTDIYIIFLFHCNAVKIRDAAEFTLQKTEITKKPVLFEYTLKIQPAFSDGTKDIDTMPHSQFKSTDNVFRNIIEERLLESRNFSEYAVTKERNSAEFKGLWDYKVKIEIVYGMGISGFFPLSILSLTMIPTKASYIDYAVHVKILGRNDSIMTEYRFDEEVSFWYAIYTVGQAEEHMYSVNAFQYIIDKILFKIQEDRIIR